MCYVGVEHGQHDLYPDPAETPGQRNGSSCLQRAPLLWRCRQHRQGTADHPSTSCSTHCTPVSAVCSCCRFTVPPCDSNIIHYDNVFCFIHPASFISPAHSIHVMYVKCLSIHQIFIYLTFAVFQRGQKHQTEPYRCCRPAP